MENASSTQRNIKEISRIENEALQRRSRSERVGDIIATQAGRIWFIVVHAIWFLVWIAVNLGAAPGIPIFDQYPFALLTMVVSLESIFLSLFILMSQNRTSRQADERNHLDLQINLLSEHENTKMLLMLRALCMHHKLDVGNDPEIKQLIERTEPAQVLQEIKENLPET